MHLSVPITWQLFTVKEKSGRLIFFISNETYQKVFASLIERADIFIGKNGHYSRTHCCYVWHQALPKSGHFLLFSCFFFVVEVAVVRFAFNSTVF